MTALAVIIGMLPMALGFGRVANRMPPRPRRHQGLVAGDVTTLFVVPIVYSLLRKHAPVDYDRRIADEELEGVGDALLS